MMGKFLKIFSIILVVILAGIAFFAIKTGSAKLQVQAQKSIKLQAQLDAEAEQQKEIEENEKLRLESIKNTLPRIICWGDSLTAGSGGGGTDYPSILANLIKLEVKNYGVGGETSEQIAYRQGGKKFFVDAVVIPSTTSKIAINLINENGERINLLDQGSSGINPCTIGGVTGEITLDKGSDTYYFKRQVAGNEVSVLSNTQVLTYGIIDNNPNDIIIIFSSTNDRTSIDKAKNIVAIQRAMIKCSGSTKFIIIGPTRNFEEDIISVLNNEYGSNYFNFRKYLLENALSDANIMPSEQDNKDLQNGVVPASLRSDDIHGNKIYYELLGKQMYKKIMDLGYLSQEQIDYLGLNKN